MTSLITGRIYKITSPNTEQCYIGSTIEKLHERFRRHIYEWRHEKKGSTSKLILEKGSAIIELLEEVQVENERELRIIEQRYIDSIPNTVNKNKAYISEEDQKERNRILARQYLEEHYEQRIEYVRKYQKEHREKLRQKDREKENYCKVCDCSVYGYSRLKRHEQSIKHIRNFIIS